MSYSKKKVLMAASFTAIVALASGGVFLAENGKTGFAPIFAGAGSYTLQVAADANLASVQSSLGNTIAFSSTGYTAGSFVSGGIVANTTVISGLKALDLTITSGSFDVYKSWDGTNYYDLALTLNSTTHTYSFSDAPSYLKIVAKEASVISNFTLDYSCAKADIPTTFVGFPVGYGTKVYDVTAAVLPYVPSGVTASWEDSSKAALAEAPSAVGSYYVKLTNGTDTLEQAYTITDYTTDVFASQPGIKVTMTVDGDTKLTKGANGEMIVRGWWAYLNLTNVLVPAEATSMVLHMKSDRALSNVEYNYSYPGVSLGSGTDMAIGTEYSDVTIACAHNMCSLTNLNILVSGATITIDNISFTPASTVPAGKTGIFSHLGTNYPTVTSEAFRGSSACHYFNLASDNSLAFGGQWWDEVLFNGATGVSIPSGKTTMTLSMKASAAFNCAYVFSGSPANFVYDEGTGFALTTAYQDFTVNLNSATMVNSFGLCTSNNYVYIKSVTFA